MQAFRLHQRPMSMPKIRTLTRSTRHESPKVKGSRFIASLRPVASAESAMAFVEATREEHRDATHNCFAWRLGPGRDAMRTSDDGEPSGTAGRPILQEIDGRRLTDLAVVVTRYYGGTKLGTGGLIRAYGGAAAAALDLAEIVERPLVETLRLAFSYDASGAIAGVLSAFGLEAIDSEYGARVELTVAVPVEETERLRAALGDATRGQVEINVPSALS